MDMKIAFKEYNHIMGRIEAAYHEAALKMNMADSEFDILYTLNTYPAGCKQSTLYKESGLTKSTVNSAIKKMEKNGIVVLTPGMGRNTYVVLTERGKVLMQNTVHKIIRIENEIFESWTKEEQDMFIYLNKDFAEKISKRMKEF